MFFEIQTGITVGIRPLLTYYMYVNQGTTQARKPSHRSVRRGNQEGALLGSALAQLTAMVKERHLAQLCPAMVKEGRLAGSLAWLKRRRLDGHAPAIGCFARLPSMVKGIERAALALLW